MAQKAVGKSKVIKTSSGQPATKTPVSKPLAGPQKGGGKKRQAPSVTVV